MGPAATGKKWGITHSDDWASNLPVLISEIKNPLLLGFSTLCMQRLWF